ncbi:carbohydrate sulfotransferase 10 isoform X2 [Lingula anatina]|uniref:Carbohydrate sulfotransferase n=1 Tax=Lingula anatina TaxID=7574 RepID=A0A2R2MNE4_LINAN|nr:carbohydrate sulfotransferase 10 isoform X2 [Lingula anatina]|eukprot:XP_023931730.1 carbohydrate sulfotransferase 10 isoform X2 [Lingula anatina]
MKKKAIFLTKTTACVLTLWALAYFTGIYKPMSIDREKGVINGSGTSLQTTNNLPKRNQEHNSIDKRIWESFGWDKVPQNWVSSVIRRKQRLKDRCSARKTAPFNYLKKLNWILVDDKYKLILCTMLKAASRNWRNVYQILSGRQDPATVVFKGRKEYYTQLYSNDYKNNSMRLASYLKILVVRHPLERLVSAYKEQVLFRFLGPRVKTYINQQYKRNITLQKHISFSDFLQYIADNGPNNIHWALVEDFCKPCDVQYDVIVHHEDLTTDAPNVLRLLGAEHLIAQFPSSHRKIESYRNATLIQKYYSGIDRELLKKVWDIYKEEASFLGYKLDL